MKKHIISLLLFSIVLFSKTLNGKVVAVLDGDTFIIVDSVNIQHRIRLSGIDAPEKGQAHGARAKEVLSSFLFKEKVTIQYNDIDKYGRVLGLVRTSVLNVNEMMIASGYAWAYLRYLYEDNDHYVAIEEKARLGKLGLWADKHPVSPWDFRHNK